MAWAQLAIDKPHLVYLILGGFTSLFMLCSSVIKERLYIGEATVATLCGIIFGPHAANLINPLTWGNTDKITLEFSRVVLVVQCFAVGVELPKAYMERHWKSVTLLLVPVMTFGWLITSLFMWALIPSVNWLDSLVLAACVTATDPVLASSVVGKGKFAKRVPKHIRDILSAESGCNDGMAFPFIYLGLYLIKYRPAAGEVIFHWVCYTILYECVFGAFYGVVIGYCARRAIRYAHEKHLIDRESFLVFYFVLALFCAGSGSLLGMDDLLIGFACGVGFSNDGWFTEKTEETHVSNVIDLLINLSFFVYFGTIIPWEQYNAENLLGLRVWRLVVIALLVLFFRRIPIMLALKPIIPDIKTWREALFCGHFGPIGVGAIFVCILARAELETDTTTPLAVLPPPDFPHDNIIELIWPVTTFLVLCSIVVHGSSIAVFTLGKHINTLTLTMSYTQANDTSWMDRLPRIQSRSKTSMSLNRTRENSFNEKLEAGALPKNFLRRQREEEFPSSRSSSRRPHKRATSYGGPISQSAIAPIRSSSHQDDAQINRSDSETLAFRSEDSNGSSGERADASGPTSPGEVYEEGHETVYEDHEGNVLEVESDDAGFTGPRREEHEKEELERLESQPEENPREPEKAATRVNRNDGAASDSKPATERTGWRKGLQNFQKAREQRKKEKESGEHGKRDDTFAGNKRKEKERDTGRGPARAYQYGNTIIVEDEDGEVIRKFDIDPPAKKNPVTNAADPGKTRERLGRMTSYLGRAKDGTSGKETDGDQEEEKKADDDDGLRFTVEAGGERMSKAQFIRKIQQMDPKSRARLVESSNVPEAVKEEAREDEKEHLKGQRQGHPSVQVQPPSPIDVRTPPPLQDPSYVDRDSSRESERRDPNDLTRVDSNARESPHRDIPSHDLSGFLSRHTLSHEETAAQRRRRVARERAAQQADEDSEDDGTERVPPRRRGGALQSVTADDGPEGETAAERRRREAALGFDRSNDADEAEEETSAERRRREAATRETEETPRQGIRFVDSAPQRGEKRGRRWR